MRRRDGKKSRFFQNLGFSSNPGFDLNQVVLGFSWFLPVPITLYVFQYIQVCICHRFRIGLKIRIMTMQFKALKLSFKQYNFRVLYASRDYDHEKFHNFNSLGQGLLRRGQPNADLIYQTQFFIVKIIYKNLLMNLTRDVYRENHYSKLEDQGFSKL